MATATQDKQAAANKASLAPLINVDAIKQRAAEYVRGKFLPRISGMFDDPRDQYGEPVPIMELIVLPVFAQELEDMVTTLIEDQFKAACYRQSEAFHPESIDRDGRPHIEDRFRIVPPFNGTLKLDRLDRLTRTMPSG